MTGHRPTLRSPLALRLCATTALLALAACESGPGFDFLSPGSDSGAEVTRAAQSTTLVERDVEAPEVFQVSEAGLWDGRPSLGGVWVAHPDVDEPERVIIRNAVTGKFVIGALFRKERETPGPKLQVSSDAATALDILAGSPVLLDVTALRRETVEEAAEAEAPVAMAAAVATDLSTETGAIETLPLDADPTIQAAAAAIESAEADEAPTPVITPAAATSLSSTAPDPAATPAVAAPTAPAPTPASVPGPRVSTEAKPFLQIGIFSIEDNARRTADTMRSAGIIPTVYDQESKGKRFWRVVVGPVEGSTDRAEVLKTVKSLGFTDAYFVTN